MSNLHAYAMRRALLFAPLIFCFSVSVSFSQEWSGSGTGFLVGPLPVVVTNHHVAAGAKQIRITFRDGRTAKGKVLSLDRRNDLALIGFDKPPEAKVRFRIASSDGVKPGQEVYVMGYPLRGQLGDRLSITKGIIASTVGFNEDNGQFRVTAQMNPGNSGGPLIDGKGRVIGVVFAGLNAIPLLVTRGMVPQGANFAIKSSLLVSMLADFAEEEVSDGVDLPDLTGDKIFSTYRDAVVLIEVSNKPEKPEKIETSEGREQHARHAGFGIWRKRVPVAPDKREANEWAMKARAGIGKGDWAEAIRAASAAIALDPTLSGPYVDRCFAYYKRTLYDDAVADCEKAVELDRINDLAYSYRALAYCEKGFTDQALVDAEQAIVLSPKNMSHYNNRGVVLEKRGATDGAVAGYEDACRGGVETACKNFTRLMGFAPSEIPRMVKDLLAESIVCFNNGQMDRVIDITSKAIKLDPNSDAAYASRGGAYANKGQLLQAIDDCNAAIRINPNCGLAFNNKGFAHEQLGQTSEALLDYEISCNLGVDLGCKNRSRMTGPRTTKKE